MTFSEKKTIVLHDELKDYISWFCEDDDSKSTVKLTPSSTNVFWSVQQSTDNKQIIKEKMINK